jgi:hypothetical protein
MYLLHFHRECIYSHCPTDDVNLRRLPRKPAHFLMWVKGGKETRVRTFMRDFQLIFNGLFPLTFVNWKNARQPKLQGCNIRKEKLLIVVKARPLGAFLMFMLTVQPLMV